MPAFFGQWVPPSAGPRSPPPPGGRPLLGWWVSGEPYIPNYSLFFLCILPCVGWVPASLAGPPPPLGIGQMVPASLGVGFCLFHPPPPLWLRNGLVQVCFEPCAPARNGVSLSAYLKPSSTLVDSQQQQAAQRACWEDLATQILYPKYLCSHLVIVIVRQLLWSVSFNAVTRFPVSRYPAVSAGPHGCHW